jgi:acetolactate decarboxylase
MTEERRLARRTRFTQVSLFSVLLSGRYDGVISVGELKKLGNKAIATMDRLDGEMPMVDGVVYQVCADGHVYLPDDDATIPFGTVAEFHAEHALKLSGTRRRRPCGRCKKRGGF